ncbi:MAG: type III polyketide synthase [Elusimicrobia bacterium]|nr:type III polyketide synthase [Elusimicrobiota bacterium]
MSATPRRGKARARLYGLGTALPPHEAGQPAVKRFMASLAGATLKGRRRAVTLGFLEKIYASSGIANRHSVLADYAKDSPADFEFYPSNWALEPFPTTAARMKVFEECSVGLAEKACRKALRESGARPAEITHLIFTTCTGLFAPGPDILLIGRLGLRPQVHRAVLGFMGCYAGFNGLRMAGQILGAEPEAVVLQVCVELCTLHFQKEALPDFIVANSLFGDGAAAAVYARPGRLEKGLGDLLATHSRVENDSLEHMSWRIGPAGFEMRLDRSVPARLKAAAPGFVGELLGKAGIKLEASAWAIHPGGRKIVDEVQAALSLTDPQVLSSREVLSACGNMSSATILFVLDRELRRASSRSVAALGFGPGLTMEGAVLTRP